MRLVLIAVAVGLGLNMFSSAAQATELQELIDKALSNNEEIKSFEYEFKAQDALINSASGLDSPVVGISTLDRGNKTQYLVVSQKIRFPNKYFMSASAQELSSKAAEQNFRAAQWRVRSHVIGLYYSLYAAQKELQLLDANMESVKEFARVAEKKYSAGKTARSDSMKAHFELTQLELEKIRLIQQENALQDKLRAAIGDEEFKNLNLAQLDLNPPQFFENKLTGISQDTSDLVARSPNLQAQVFKLEEASTRSRLAQWEFMPDFQLQYQKRVSGLPEDSSIFSVGLTIPLWFWNQSSRASAAKARKMAQTHRLKEIKLALFANIKDLLGKVKTGQKTLKIYQTSLLPQAHGAYNSSRSAYQANRTSFLDLLDSERSLYKVKTGYYHWLSQYVADLSQLESLMGDRVSNIEKAQGAKP